MNPIQPAHLFESRLVQLLSKLQPPAMVDSEVLFTERFGQLIDFAGSVTLSKTIDDLTPKRAEAPAATPEAVIASFLGEREALVRFIVSSFAPGVRPNVGYRVNLPSPEKLHAHFEASGLYSADRPWTAQLLDNVATPHRKFYIAHQHQFENRITGLRERIEHAIAPFSSKLAQLSLLNRTFDSVLRIRTRSLFTIIPELLGRRFGRMLDQHHQALSRNPNLTDLEQWMQPGGWISAFNGDMQQFLLAELETRLQPILGMLEALPPNVPSIPGLNAKRNNGGD